MTGRITKQEVIHIAQLARLKLSEEEIDLFSEQLERILEYVGQLPKNELPPESISPLLQSTGLKNVMREDEVNEFQDKEAIIKNAPDRYENFFKVKKVIE